MAAPSSATQGTATSPSPFAGWLDPTGTADIHTVQRQAIWEPFTGWQGWAFGPEPVWLRVAVPAASGPDAPPDILVLRPPFLDRVTFYDPTLGLQRRAGDFFPATEDALGSVLFTFEVPALPVDRHVFVKIQSTSTRLVHLSLLPRPAAQAHARWVEWATAGALILSFVFLVWALVQWLMTRDRVMGFFAFKQLWVTLWGFFLLGFARVTVGPWFAEGVLSMISSVVIAVMASSILWFFSAFLEEYRPRRWMVAVMRAMAWSLVGVCLLNLAGLTRLALQIVNVAAPLVLMLIFLTLVAAKPEGQRPPISKAVLVGYLGVYAALNAMPALTHLGLIPESAILFVGNMSVLVLDGLVMLVMLAVRQRRFKEQHQAVTTQLMLQKEQARLDQQYLDEQRKLLAMLAHEMKTPLANLRLWMEAGPKGRSAMERAIHDMNRLIERCVHTGQLSDQSLQPRNEWIDAAEVTRSHVSTSRQPGRVVLDAPVEGCPLHADPQMLSIVLGNVLENAFKYSAPGSPIEVRLAPQPGPQGEAGWCWQADNVPGAAGLPDAARVFEKYYRSPHAQRQSGSGLGLFLVKSLLELMGGRVAYAPAPDRARFEVWLPRDFAGRPEAGQAA